MYFGAKRYYHLSNGSRKLILKKELGKENGQRKKSLSFLANLKIISGWMNCVREIILLF